MVMVAREGVQLRLRLPIQGKDDRFEQLHFELVMRCLFGWLLASDLDQKGV